MAAARIRDLAVAKFGLLPVPHDALAASPALRALHDDEAAWAAYAKARKLPLTRRRPRGDDGSDGDDGDDGDEEDARLRKRVVATTRRHLAKSGVALPTRKLLLSQLDAFYDAEIDEDVDDVRTLSAESTLWSPWALPTGLSLECDYRYVPRNVSVDFELALRTRVAPVPSRVRPRWAPLLSVRWDWEEGRPRRGWGGRHRDDESMADASDEDESDSDGSDSEEEGGWGGGASDGGELVKVETAHSPGLTPATARQWREAVGGPGGALLPAAAVPDYALVSAAVRVGMADGAPAAARQTGHVWRATAADADAMKAAGVWATVLEEERLVGRESVAAQPFSPDCIQRDWWEVAIRRATGAARAADAYYRETSDVEE